MVCQFCFRARKAWPISRPIFGQVKGFQKGLTGLLGLSGASEAEKPVTSMENSSKCTQARSHNLQIIVL